MSTKEELNESFESLERIALKVKRDRDALLAAAKAALGVLDEVTTIEDNCAYIKGKYHGLVDIWAYNIMLQNAVKVQAKVRQAIKEAENE